jgi:hypothetical protein
MASCLEPIGYVALRLACAHAASDVWNFLQSVTIWAPGLPSLIGMQGEREDDRRGVVSCA